MKVLTCLIEHWSLISMMLFRQGQWGQFAPAEIGIAPTGINSAPL